MPLGKSEKQEREIMRESKNKGKEKTGRRKCRRMDEKEGETRMCRCFSPNIKHCVTFFLGKSSEYSVF